MAEAEWSEHCSYKSSREHLRELPREGPLALRMSGHDSGILDAGDGYVVTVHIESHNHPSAVEPRGGAATGVGGVVRDILSSGTRPIAVLDGLRFGDPISDPRAAWLLRGAAAGVSDYGNCIGVPTVGGEIAFDPSYAGYAVVDVAAVGFGRRDRLVRNEAGPGDAVVLLGGPTGRDGMGGSQFASGALRGGGDRAAVQVPDPFAEKLVIEAVLEARAAGIVRAVKDVGGGGLACAVSEAADALSVGIDVDASAVHAREPGMSPAEVMVSESQERMLVVARPGAVGELGGICGRLGVRWSVIGEAAGHGLVRVRDGAGNVLASIPARLLANAPPARRRAEKPPAPPRAAPPPLPASAGGASEALRALLASPNVRSSEWAHGAYDWGVGLRTAVGPGGDAAALRLDNGRHLAVSMDGNPLHCAADPRRGAAGCFEEACRNVVCAGAAPAGMVDHLQFGDPGDPAVFWSFLESIRGLSEYGRASGVPCVGGKVSFYNGTPRGPIRPTPVVCVLGLTGKGEAPLGPRRPRDGDALFAVGLTDPGELGGSEYLAARGLAGGRVPRVDAAASAAASAAVLSAVRAGLAGAAHDCSKGGLAAAVVEMCVRGAPGDPPPAGCSVDLGLVPCSGPPSPAGLMFSETHSRYLLAARDPAKLEALLAGSGGLRWARIGRFGGDSIRFGGGGLEGGEASIPSAEASRAWRRPPWGGR